MLHKEIVQGAIDLAQELDRRNIGLVAKGGTLVEKLVSCSIVQEMPEVAIGLSPEDLRAQYQPDAEAIERESSLSATVQIDGEQTPLGNAHSETMQAAITALQDVVGPHLEFARNIAKPAVLEFQSRIEAALNNIPTTATFNPVIRKICAPEPLAAAVLVEAITEHTDEPFMPVPPVGELPLFGGQQLLEMMLTGNKVLDVDIEQWAARIGLETLETAWNAAFTTAGGGKSFDSLTDDPVGGVDVAMATFLLARRLIDKPIEGVSMTLSDWTIAVGKILRQAALRLNHALENFRRDESLGLMLIRWNKDEVAVNKDVYNRFVEGGGTDVILFGNMLADAPDIYVNNIMAKAAANIETWERQNTLLSAAAAHRWFANAKGVLLSKAEEMIADNLSTFYVQPGEDGVVAMTMNHPEVAVAMDKITAYVEELDEVAIRELWSVATFIIAGCVFHYTSALQLLSGINRYCQLNPGMDPAEAARLSTIDYLTDYVVAQLVARPI